MSRLFQPCTNFTTILCSLIFLLSPILVSSTCTCQTQVEEQNKSEALQYKLIAIAAVLSSGALGVCLPFMVKNLPSLNPDNDIYFLIKAFAAGVILSTGFIHVFPDAYESLTSPCLSENPWRQFPFAGFVAMFSAIGTLMMESLATGYHKRSELNKAQPFNGDEEISHDHGASHNADNHHIHGSSFDLERSNFSELIRQKIISQVLEIGIVVHSVIIGVSLGASQSPKIIKPLVAALSFHQFFEGVGLGGCIYQAKFKRQTVATMVLFFSLTTPAGIAVGTGISNTYNEKSPSSLIIQGLLLAASAGVLIYMSLVDLLAADFMNSKMVNNFKLQLAASFALILGACTMSLLVKWGEP
ncbi:Zinc/iron permease [Parasponia andersonii]|uniref:Zinc/iron permease n=1 Tax=Parasponia andersonii TaxID=3476 RepID=A0A2P5CIR4_PARAD|nr:Zinc/iron permease [Parasponia andersonii]